MAPEKQWPTQISDTDIVSRQPMGAREPAVVTAGPQGAVAPPYTVGRSLGIGLAILAAAGLGILGAALLFKHHHGAVTTGTTAPAVNTRRRVAVPAVTGFDRQEAAAVLKAAGLKLKTHVRTTGPADGAILSQQPAASSHVVAGSTVTLVIDRAAGANPAPGAVSTTTQTTTTAAPKTSAVPHVTGMAEQAAVQSLFQAGVEPLIVFVPSHDELGTVEGQARSSGTRVLSQTPMQITVSRGSGQNPDEIVPSVVGMTFNAALAAIQHRSLRFIYLKQPVTQQNQAGTIISQTPPPGAHAPRNGQVLVYLAAFRPPG